MIREAKPSLDIVSIIESAGVGLKQRGRRYVGLCPFHTENNPSFYVFPDQRFKCFGCGEYGDVIAFIQKLHGLSFPDALKHLGIKHGPVTAEIRQEIQKRKKRAELVKRFRQWEWDYYTDISDLWHKTKKLMTKGITPDDLELYAPLLHMLPIWEYHREILMHGTDREKFELYKEAQKNERFRFSG